MNKNYENLTIFKYNISYMLSSNSSISDNIESWLDIINNNKKEIVN